MNGSTSSAPASESQVEAHLDNAVIDTSCRTLLLPIFAGVTWLVISALLALLTSIKLHSPTFLSGSQWLTYGMTFAAARNAFVYGFASQVGLAIALWILCRLGRTTLFAPVAISIAAVFWNVAMAIGVLGILGGTTTGFEWLEFSRPASAILLASYIIIGVCAFVTLANRRVRELYASQWYIIAALLWFPWLYTTARLLLVSNPVRGAAQIVVNSWFANGLFVLWLTGLALAILFYFIPRLSGRPLFSRTLAVFGFWTLALFGCWGALYRGLPVPAWMISVSVAAAVLLLVPLIATVINLWGTLQDRTRNAPPLLGFFRTALIFLAACGVLHVGMLACTAGIRLTLFAEGLELLTFYGFLAFTLFGALHYVVPRLAGEPVLPERSWKLNCWGTLLGVLLAAVPLLIGGVVQGIRLGNGSIPFLDVMNATKGFIRISTVGLLLIVVGNAAMFLRVLSALRECCRNCCGIEQRAPVRPKLKPAKAR